MTLSGFLAISLLLGLPFISASVIACVPCLGKSIATHHTLIWAIGIAGLGCLLVGLVGSLPRAYGLLLTLVGGSVSGFAMFSLRRADNDDRGDDGPQPPRRDPPRGPDGDLPIDWPLFDRLRAGWETHELRPAEPGTHSRP